MKVPPPGSSISLLGESTGAQNKSASSSLRSSLRANQQDSLRLHRSSLGTDLLKDQLTKVRSPLSPTLFTPDGEESGESYFSKPLKHTALMEKLQQIYDESETAENGGENFVQSSDHIEAIAHGREASEKEVIRQRIKFKKKLMSSSTPGKNAKAKKTHDDIHPNRRKTVAPAQPTPLAASLSTATTSSHQTSTLTSSEHKALQPKRTAPLLPQDGLHIPTENKSTPGTHVLVYTYSDI